MVQMQVTDVRRAGENHILILAGDGRELKIWVGEPEAKSIAVALEAVELPRPMSYDLTAALLRASGTAVRDVRVSRLAERTFYAEVVLADGTEVDARPSDAINLARVTGAPILISEDVLAEAAKPDPEWVDERARQPRAGTVPPAEAVRAVGDKGDCPPSPPSGRASRARGRPRSARARRPPPRAGTSPRRAGAGCRPGPAA
jgi:bifunctional DNase/RNase